MQVSFPYKDVWLHQGIIDRNRLVLKKDQKYFQATRYHESSSIMPQRTFLIKSYIYSESLEGTIGSNQAKYTMNALRCF